MREARIQRAFSLMLLVPLLFLTFTAYAQSTPESVLLYQKGVFSFITNHKLTVADPAIENAIIVVHGSERNVDTYFNSVNGLAKQEGRDKNTIVIAPHYKESKDTLRPNEFYWTSEGWLKGDTSKAVLPISSFDVLDGFVSLLANKRVFPNLKTVTITGHSAGGQLTQRYALGNSLDQRYPKIHFRYLVANPGSYVYLTPKRPLGGNRFDLPSHPACAYNDYKYGLDRPNRYLSKAARDILVKNYLAKDIHYLVGEKDIVTDELDADCPAQHQGNTRYERAVNFKAQLDFEFPNQHHPLRIVPGVGHTQWGMYSSTIGIQELFQK